MLAPLTTASARALLSPSARVLVASAEPDVGASRARDLPWSDVHWPTLVSLTSFERAESQLFRLLRIAPVGAVPDDVTRVMQGIYRVAVFRSAELADAAIAACDALDAAGVTALWLKGAALAMQSADGFALRSMGDLDVLVAPAQMPAARRALLAAGWASGVPEATYDQHHHDAPLFWRSGIRLELHAGLFVPGHPFADDQAERWFARAVTVPWGTRRVLVLPPAWHLVHASVHWAWSHEGEVGTWQYLHDAHRLAGSWNGPEESLADLTDFTRLIHAERPVGWALWLASRLGSVPIDERVVDGLRGPARLISRVAEREWVLRAFHSPAASPSVAWSRFWWRKAMAGLGDAGGSWPWTRGRAAVASAGTGRVGDRAGAEASRLAESAMRAGQIARWRRHLGRVLRG